MRDWRNEARLEATLLERAQLAGNVPPKRKKKPECPYCGVPIAASAAACSEHRDLPARDPGYRPKWSTDAELAAELEDSLADARRRNANNSYVKRGE